METLMRLGVVFRVIDKFSGPMKAATRAFGHMRESLARLGRQFRDFGTKALMIGGAAGLALAAPANAFGKFQAEMAAVRVTSTATAEDMRALSNMAIRIGIETEHSPLAAAQGFRALAQAGLNVRQQMEAIRPALLFATAGQIDVGLAADTTASAINAFGLRAGEAARVVDVLTKATNLSQLRAGEFKLALGNLGLEAQASNQKFEAMIAALGLLRSTGLTAENAAEKMRMTLSALRSPTDDARKLMAKLGIQTRDANGGLLPFAQIVDNIQRRIGGLPKPLQDQITSTLLGRDAMLAYQGALKATFTDATTGQVFKGTAALREMQRQLEASRGTAHAFAQEYLGTWPGKIQLLSGSFQTLSLVMGKHIASTLAPYVNWITAALNKTIAWAQANPKAARALAHLGVVVAVTTTGLGVLLLTLWGVTAALRVLLSPATLVILAVAAVGAGAYWLAKNINAAFAWIRNTVADSVAWLLDQAAKVADALPAFMLPTALRGNVLRATAAGLRDTDQLGRQPEPFRFPSIGNVMKDVGLGSLAELLGVKPTEEPGGRVIHLHGGIVMNGVQDAQALLDGLEQAAAGMAPQE